MRLDFDDFVYADGDLATVSGGKFTQLSSCADLVVTTHNVGGTEAESCAVVTVWSGSTTDQYAQLAMSTPPGIDDGGPAIRCSTVGEGYIVHVVSTAFQLFKMVAVAFTLIGSGGTPVDGDTVYLEMQGTTLVVQQNGVTRVTVAGESSIASGAPGMHCYSAAARYGHWEAGDFTIEPIVPGFR